MVELRLFGGLQLVGPNSGGVEALTRQSKRIALLVYLGIATPRGLHRRDKLVGLFWPELDSAHARNALSQALHVIRTSLGERVIVSRGDEEVGIATDAMWIDVLAFENELDAGKPNAALQLYRGDLLDGFFVASSPEFEKWLEGERERQRHRAADAAWTLANQLADYGDRPAAARWAIRAGAMSPFDESMGRRLMTLLSGLGDRAAALRAYEAFAARMRTDLDLVPSAETRALADRIRTLDETTTVPDRSAPRAEPDVLTSPRSRRRGPALFALAGSAALAVVLGAAWWKARPTTRATVNRYAFDVAHARPIAMGVGGATLALSPDGRRVVYLGSGEHGAQFFLRDLDRLEATAIPNTVGARHPFFSPDGEWLGFELNGVLRKAHIDDGVSSTIATVGKNIHGASWGSRDVIVFATDHALWRVSSKGGAPIQFAAADSQRGEIFRWPEVLPGGSAVLFTVSTRTGMWLASASLVTGLVRSFGVQGTNPHFVPPDHLVFARMDGSLLETTFNASRVEVSGSPRIVAQSVTVGIAGAAKVGVSRSGSIAYVREARDRSLVFVDRLGNREAIKVAPGRFGSPRLSTDGRRVAVAIGSDGPSLGDLWVIDLTTNASRRITTDSSSVVPVWSSDGASVAFATMLPGDGAGFSLRRVSVSGVDSAELLLPAKEGQLPHDFSPDGRRLLFSRRDAMSRTNLWTMDLARNEQPRPYLVAPGDQHSGTVSPNGRWAAYVSSASGREEVYVSAFPNAGATVLVSAGGGREPRWARNGRELFYRSRDGMISVTVHAASTFRVRERRRLFDDDQYATTVGRAGYDVHPDSERFLMVQRPPSGGELVVLLNWLSRQGDASGPP